MQYVPMDEKLWDKKRHDIRRGANKFDIAGQFIEAVFPGWKCGIFTEEDIEDRFSTEGYIVLSPQHFKEKMREKWNKEVSLRYGFREEDGAIMMGRKDDRLFVCVRPADFDSKRRENIFRESEDRYSRARLGKAYEIKESLGGRFDVGASLVETTSQVSPEQFSEGASEESHETYVNAEQLAAKAGRRPGRPKTGGTE